MTALKCLFIQITNSKPTSSKFARLIALIDMKQFITIKNICAQPADFYKH